MYKYVSRCGYAPSKLQTLYSEKNEAYSIYLAR